MHGDEGMCPPNFHLVRGHLRTCHSGTKTTVKTHIAKNPKHKDGSHYFSENLRYVYFVDHTVDAKLHLGKICGFAEYEEIDDVISFWMDFWKNKGLIFPDDLTPRHIKAMIAYESSFDPEVKAKSKKSTALGLMQVTSTARNALSRKKNKSGYQEVKRETIAIEHPMLKDVVINVAVGTRWLAHKYTTIPKKMERTAFNIIKNYNQWNEEGTKYATNIMELYNKKCP